MCLSHTALRELEERHLLLVPVLLARHVKRIGKRVDGVDNATIRCLMASSWRGNVRELDNMLERAVILGHGAMLEPEDFTLGAPVPRVAAAAVVPAGGADLNLDRIERKMVEAALTKHGYNISLAAQELGLSRAALYRRMEKHGL